VLGWAAPNALGTVFVVGQPLLVLGFALMEALGLRASSPGLAAA
jgi:hypothetical protein